MKSLPKKKTKKKISVIEAAVAAMVAEVLFAKILELFKKESERKKTFGNKGRKFRKTVYKEIVRLGEKK